MLVAVSSIVIPKLKTSAALLYRPCRTSGARYNLSPSRSKEDPLEASDEGAGRGHNDAMPKSPIFSRPEPVMKMLAGLRSR